jgi:flavin-dependent dehydrogenase
LQIWQGFTDEGHQPCLGSRSAWGEDRIGYNDFLLNPHGAGWHLNRRKFGAFLASKATQSGAQLKRGTSFVSAERGAEGFELLLKTGEGALRVAARLVVDATGSRFRLAKIMGARPLLHDRLVWIGAVLGCPAELNFSRLTMLEAVEDGWWYAASVPDGRVVVAAITDAETNKRAMLHQPDRWLCALKKTRHMAGWLADCSLGDDQRMTIDAAPSFMLDKVCGSNWLAVGDAASACDPIASQGIHNALSDGLQAAAAIADHLAGVGAAFDQYQAAIGARFTDYLNNRNYFYDLERRWPSSAFWQNRRQRSAHPMLPGHE